MIFFVLMLFKKIVKTNNMRYEQKTITLGWIIRLGDYFIYGFFFNYYQIINKNEFLRKITSTYLLLQSVPLLLIKYGCEVSFFKRLHQFRIKILNKANGKFQISFIMLWVICYFYFFNRSGLNGKSIFW